ncbi:MAG: beta-propeller domain-containing protein [Desulfuromonadales bacterium]|nr:beta-propeller domain-containing protein [Desulfuromonadales bacterium]
MGKWRHCCRWLLLFGLSLLLTACSNSGKTELPDDGQPSRLVSFVDCEQLQSYFAQSAELRSTLEAQFDSTPAPAADIGLDGGAAADVFQAETAREYTGTNVQEAGVDEADFSKTDGDYLYLVTGGNFMIFDVWPAEEMVELSRVEMEGNPFALFVEQDKALVLSHVWDYSALEDQFAPQSWQMVKLSLFDLTDRSAPELLREIYLEGNYVDARMVEGRLHLVVSSGVYTYGIFPPIPASADPLLVDTVAGAEIDPALTFPRIIDKIYTAEGVASTVDEICSCENVYRPETGIGTGLLTLFTLDLADPLGKPHSVSLLGDSGLIYASPDSLIVAAQNNNIWAWQPVAESTASRPQASTFLHKFTLGSAPDYSGSGKIKGWVLNQFSLSEHEGVLRVATTEPTWVTGDQPENRLFLLQQNNESLEEIGRLEGLGKPGESIFAVRFVADKGFVVTFERTDPLYALDLSQPTTPRVAGELEVPGFSTYLHPLANDQLLAVGREGNSTKLSLFDVADLTAPVELASTLVGDDSYSEAEYDHHAFTWFAKEQVLALPVTAWSWSGGLADYGGYEVFAGLHLYDVSAEAGISLRGKIDHEKFYRDELNKLWYAPEPVRRSFFIGDEGQGDYLYSISRRGLMANDLLDLVQEVSSADLPSEDIYWIYPLEVDGI